METDEDPGRTSKQRCAVRPTLESCPFGYNSLVEMHENCSGRHPNNAVGPFYVENGQCMACGAPEAQSDGLMSHTPEGHCYFDHQPATDDETNAAIRAVWSSCCGALRYGGDDPGILIRLAELGMSSQCDNRLSNEPRAISRNCAIFDYAARERNPSSRIELRRIVDYLVQSLKQLSNGRCAAVRCHWNKASVRYEWGDCSNPKLYAVVIHLERRLRGGWKLRISDHEVAHTAFAVYLDRALQASAEFQRIQWFSEHELVELEADGRPHPY